jgi:hypothetical protein
MSFAGVGVGRLVGAVDPGVAFDGALAIPDFFCAATLGATAAGELLVPV